MLSKSLLLFCRAFLFTSLLILTACGQENKPSRSVEVAKKGLHTGALSSTASLATAGSILHGGSLWRLDDNERLFNWNHTAEEPTTMIASDFSDDDRWALTADPHTMVLWNTASGEGERFWTAPAEVLDVELNRDGTLALLGLEDHSAVIFDIRRGGIRRTLQHQNRVRSVDLSKNGRLAITGSEDYSAAIWDTASGKRLHTLAHDDDVQLVILSDDGELAFTMSKYDKASIWKTRSGEQISKLPLRAEQLKRGLRFTSARFNSSNEFLLTGRPDQIVQLWRVETMEEIQRWTLPKRDRWKPTGAAVLDIAFNDDSHFTAIASNGFVHQLTLSDSEER